MFLQGNNLFSAFDVYTGRQLWKRSVPVELGSTGRFKGGRFVAAEDAVYLVSADTLLGWDADTAKPLANFKFSEKDSWHDLKVYKDVLIALGRSRVVALDRHTGQVLWEHDEPVSSVAVGGGRAYCLSLSGGAEQARRRGAKAPSSALESAFLTLTRETTD